MNNTNNESGAVRIQAGDLRRLDHLRDINLTTDTMDFQKLAGEYKSELLDSAGAAQHRPDHQHRCQRQSKDQRIETGSFGLQKNQLQFLDEL